MDWTEKYRPQTLDCVVGNPTAVNSLRAWARSWEKGIPEVRVAVLRGPPGVGKTTSVEALAREMGWSIIEMNASDQRTGKAIEVRDLQGRRLLHQILGGREEADRPGRGRQLLRKQRQGCDAGR